MAQDKPIPPQHLARILKRGKPRRSKKNKYGLRKRGRKS